MRLPAALELTLVVRWGPGPALPSTGSHACGGSILTRVALGGLPGAVGAQLLPPSAASWQRWIRRASRARCHLAEQTRRAAGSQRVLETDHATLQLD